jgi:hypothetical protein
LIDFRYHLVSIIAVFVALAIGIVLGSGPLDEPIDNTLRQRYEQVETDKELLRSELDRAQSRIDYLDEASATYSGSLVSGRLTDRSVVLVTMPEVDDGLANDTRELLQRGGATVTGTVGITDAYADPARLEELEGILDESTPAGTEIPDDAEPYERAAAVLARSLVRSPEDAPGTGAAADAATAGSPADPTTATADPTGGDPTGTTPPQPDDPANGDPETPDPEAEKLLGALQDAGFLALDGSPDTRAEYAVILAPVVPDPVPDNQDGATRAALELALAVDGASGGSVVAGPFGSAGEGGLIAAVRGDDEAESRVSTVDTLDTVLGRVGTVLALNAQSGDTTGHYGVGQDADEIAPELVIPGVPDSEEP